MDTLWLILSLFVVFGAGFCCGVFSTARFLGADVARSMTEGTETAQDEVKRRVMQHIPKVERPDVNKAYLHSRPSFRAEREYVLDRKSRKGAPD